MGAVIFTLAFVLVIGGLAALVNAINLIPTDLGLAWLQIGFTLLSSGVIVLVIGLAAKMLGQQKSAPAQPRTEPSLPDWSALPPGEETKHPVIAAPEAAKSSDLAKAGVIAGAGIAAGALISTAMAGSEKIADGANSVVDDFERDLFADLPESPPADDAAVTDSTDENAKAGHDDGNLLKTTSDDVKDTAQPETKNGDDKADEEDAETAPSAEPTPVTPPDEPDDAATLIKLDDFELPPLPPILQPALSPIPDAPKVESVEPVGALVAPIVIEGTATPSVPGLIADADLAALTSDEPMLAPLETLDIVGSYDSGGTRFTMYSDGTVTAVGPTMDRRFISLDALRKFIDGGAV